MTNVRKQRWRKENNKGIFRMRLLKLLSIFFFSIGVKAQTEKNIDHQNLLWTRYCNQLELNNKWSVHSEFDNRIFVNPIEQNLFVVRFQGRYKAKEQIELGAGFAYFSVATQDPGIKTGFDVPEYRGQQDISVKQSLGKITLTHRYQMEERFFRNFNKGGLADGTTFFLRFRYRIQGDYTFWKKEQQYLKAIISDEIMINGGNKIIKNTFDQNRIYAALQFGINPSLAAEVGYLNSFQQKASGVDYFDRNIIRISIYHKLKI
jgi:hypothetical protein